MPTRTLTNYAAQEAQKDYIPSGVKSPNSDREMMLISPLVKHPELRGLYQAIDLGDDTTKPWYGWVKYTPTTSPQTPPPVVEKTPEQLKHEEYHILFAKLKDKKNLFDLGLLTRAEYDAFVLQVKTLGKEIGVL